MKPILNKKGALELSVGTIVVIVLAMSMLILGLVLVRNIFGGATESVDTLNDQVMSEIVNLFGDESGNLLIKLGSSNVAKVKPGERFNVAIGVQHPNGEAVTARDQIQFKITLDDDSQDNCLRKLGQTAAQNLFDTPLSTWNDIEKFSGSVASALIEIDIPKGTARCTQKVEVDVKEKEAAQPFEGDFFILEVGKEGIF